MYKKSVVEFIMICCRLGKESNPEPGKYTVAGHGHFEPQKAPCLMYTVPCKETRLFGIFPYKLVIFKCFKITLNMLENLSFSHDFFKII